MTTPVHVVQAVAVLAAAGWSAARLASRPQSPGAWLVGCALVPVVLGVPSGLVRLAGWSADAGAAATALVIAALLVAAVARERHAHAASAETGVSLASAVPVALGAAAVVALAYAVNPILALHSDAWFHAAVVARVHDVGVPPLDPYYAGLRLLYFWFFHVYIDAVSTLSGLDAFGVMAVSNVAAIALFVLAVSDVARVMGGGPRTIRAAAILSVLGVNPAGWIFLVTRAAVGETHGWDEITQSVLGGASILPALGWHYTGSLSFWPDKFFVGTAFSLALVPMVLVAGLALRAVRDGDGSVRTACECGGLALVLAMLHSVLALASIAALTSAMAVAWRRAPHARRAAVAVFLGASAGVALTSLYLYFLLAGKERSPVENPRLDVENLWTGAAAGALLWVCLLAGWIRRARRGGASAGERAAWSSAIAWLAGAAVLAAVCPLPGPNENKFLYPILALAAALAAPGAVWLYARAARAVGTLAAVVLAGAILAPTCAIGLAAFVLDAGAFAPASLDPTATERAAYAWIAHATPRDAIVLDAGGRRDALVYARRDLLWGGSVYADQWGYPRAEIARRREALDHIFAGGLTAEDEAFLRSFQRPVIALSRATGPQAAGTDLVELYRNADIVIHAVAGTIAGRTP